MCFAFGSERKNDIRKKEITNKQITEMFAWRKTRFSAKISFATIDGLWVGCDNAPI
jgi:hypothetical protein